MSSPELPRPPVPPRHTPATPKPSLYQQVTMMPSSVGAIARSVMPGAGKDDPDVGRHRVIAGFLVGGVVAAGVGAYLYSQQPPGKTAQRVKPHVLCGAQPNTTASGAAKHWKQKTVTVHIDDSVDKVGPWARQAIQLGFGTWLQGAGNLPQLTFDSTSGATLSLEPDGKSTVLVAPIDLEGHQDDLAITIAFAREGTGEIIEADVVFNTKYTYQDVASTDLGRQTLALTDPSIDSADACKAPPPEGCGEVYDLQSVAVHEVGHFFGLGEEREKPADSMYWCTGRCEVKKRSLTDNDVDSVAAVYQDVTLETTSTPAATPQQATGSDVSANDGDLEPAVGCGGASVAGSMPPSGFVGFGLLGAAALLASRRRRSAKHA